jgi:hypothetical protein
MLERESDAAGKHVDHHFSRSRRRSRALLELEMPTELP